MVQCPAPKIDHNNNESPDSITTRSLLDLPREIRHNIYRNVSKMLGPITLHEHRKYSHHVVKSKRGTFWISVAAWNLIRCRNRTIAFEAALSVYEFNTFVFYDKDIWHVLSCFLRQIGEANRRQLRNLVVHASEGLYFSSQGFEHVEAHRLGSLQIRKGQMALPSMLPTILTYSTSAIKDCFRLLGKAGPALTLTMETDPILPGCTLPESLRYQPRNVVRVMQARSRPCPVGTGSYCDALEQLNAEHMSEPGRSSRNDIFWKAEFQASGFSMADIELCGWEIVRCTGFVIPLAPSLGNLTHTTEFLRVIARRRTVNKVLQLAADAGVESKA